MPVDLRPLRPEDVEAADAVAWAALAIHIPEEFHPDDAALRAQRGRRRIAHLQETDPGGAWVADRDGEVVGVALGIVREGVWGLSLLGVAPELFGQGAGRRLLAAALGHGEGTRGGIILSSTDPRAMRSYARAGFALRPCVALAGPVNATRIPDGLRSAPADLDDARAVTDRASRHVRGASHAADLPTLLATGGALLTCEDRGFAVHRDGSPVLLAAVDEEAATDLLWSCLAAAGRGATVHVDFLAAGHDWAVHVGLAAGLSLSPEGPVYVRGDVGPMAPYLPSGAYL